MGVKASRSSNSQASKELAAVSKKDSIRINNNMIYNTNNRTIKRIFHERHRRQ
jgi:hypothetical protein